MVNLFMTIFNMSMRAIWLILAVILLRLLLKKTPKWITCALYLFVAIRLVCPISIESRLSVVPSAERTSAEILHTALVELSADGGETADIHASADIPAVVNIPDHAANAAAMPVAESSAALTPSPETIVASVWLVGVLAMLAYALVSYILTRRRVREAVHIRDNIWRCEHVASPFVLGIFKPRIYLPIGVNPSDEEYIIAHERAHLYRRDQHTKQLWYFILAVHWFNPLAWAAYILMCRDIELACDELAIGRLGEESKKPYSSALINCSTHTRGAALCPLPFAEKGVKERVKNVLNYKKPAILIVVAAIVACAAMVLCLFTDPVKYPANTEIDAALGEFLDETIAERNSSKTDAVTVSCIDKEILGVDQREETTTVYMWVLFEEYEIMDADKTQLAPEARVEIENGRAQLCYCDESGERHYLLPETGSHIPVAVTVKKTADGYELVEYWEPRDGRYYKGDIKSKFPSSLRKEALDESRYAEAQSRRCYMQYLEKRYTRGLIDEVDADIDGDGTIEHCTLHYGTTSGLFTFAFGVTSGDGQYKYFGLFCTDYWDLSFDSRDGKTIVVAQKNNADNAERRAELDIVVMDFGVCLLSSSPIEDTGAVPTEEEFRQYIKDLMQGKAVRPAVTDEYMVILPSALYNGFYTGDDLSATP